MATALLNSLLQLGSKATQSLTQQKTPAPAPAPTLSPSQQSAQAWINNPKSGHGDLNAYIANQNQRYSDAYQAGDKDTVAALLADSQRAGYNLTYTPPKPAPAPAPSNSDVMMQQFMELMNAMNNQNSQQWEQQRLYAEQQAAKIAEERRASFQNAISGLSGSQQSEMEMLNSRLAGAKSDLEDRSFQDFLEARQAMANRGLAGTGLASDQDTRLLLGQGRELAKINRDATAQAGDIQRHYGNQIADIHRQLSGVNASDIESQLFQQMFESGNKSLSDQANLYLKMLGETMGYDYVKAGDLLDKQFQYDKLGSEEKRFYDKLDYENKQFYAKLDSEERQLVTKLQAEESNLIMKLKADYEINMTKIMGKDANGNPTVDMLKLSEEIRHNRANENFAARDATMKEKDLDYKYGQMAIQAEQFEQKMANTQWSTQLKAMNDIVKVESDRVKDLSKQLASANAKNRPTLEKAYNDAVGKLEAAYQTMRNVSEIFPKSSAGRSGQYEQGY